MRAPESVRARMKLQVDEAAETGSQPPPHARTRLLSLIILWKLHTHATREAEAASLRATLLSGTRALFNLAAGAGATSRGGSACEGRAAA